MAPLNWQEQSQKHSSHVPSSGSNLWFGISMALLGVIVGFGIAAVMKGGVGASVQIPSQKVAQVPSAPTPQQAPAPAAGPLQPIDPKTDRIRGDLGKARIAVIEYSDFECPFCKRHFPTMQQVVSTYGDKVAFVYRDFPLGFHPNAQKEAEAGRCIFELGGNDAFWKYHDYVFNKTTSGGTGFALDQLPVAAKDAGVNVGKFQTCLDSDKYAKTVADEMSGGSSAGVNGTPGTIILDVKTQKSQLISGAVPFSSFKSAIDAMLQ